MRFPWVPMILGSIFVVALACSGGTATTSGGGTASQTQASFCDARESRTKQCAPDGSVVPTFDRAGCTRDYDCAVATLVSPDTYLSCRTNPDCNGASTGNDACHRQAANGRTVALSDTCAKKYAECKAAGGKSFDDDTCPILNALTDAINARLAECFDKPCDQIDACLEASYEAAAPPCK